MPVSERSVHVWSSMMYTGTYYLEDWGLLDNPSPLRQFKLLFIKEGGRILNINNQDRNLPKVTMTLRFRDSPITYVVKHFLSNNKPKVLLLKLSMFSTARSNFWALTWQQTTMCSSCSTQPEGWKSNRNTGCGLNTHTVCATVSQDVRSGAAWDSCVSGAWLGRTLQESRDQMLLAQPMEKTAVVVENTSRSCLQQR